MNALDFQSRFLTAVEGRSAILYSAGFAPAEDQEDDEDLPVFIGRRRSLGEWEQLAREAEDDLYFAKIEFGRLDD